MMTMTTHNNNNRSLTTKHKYKSSVFRAHYVDTIDSEKAHLGPWTLLMLMLFALNSPLDLWLTEIPVLFTSLK